jgi:hypothetical protein
MNARELVSELLLIGPQDKNVEYAYIANRMFGLRLNSGGPLHDLMDFKLFLHELSEAWRFAEFPEGTRFPESPKLQVLPELSPRATAARMPRHYETIDVCIRCGHVHEGAAQCGVSIGEGRFCRCELEVSA